MTDKQIIIDGCDVSGCEWFKKWNSGCSLFDGSCGGHSKCESELSFNCYYKQLKRKEQECERLNTQIRALKMNRLNMFEHLGIVQENKKLKQTLTEIKEIAYELTNEEYTDFIEGKQKQIIQKISEVEDGQI